MDHASHGSPPPGLVDIPNNEDHGSVVVAPSEQRKHARCSVGLEARLSTLEAEVDPQTSTSFYLLTEARTLDVGEAGAALCIDDGLPTGCRVLIELHLPDGTLVLRRASICWGAPGLESYCLGVCFDETVPGLVERISQPFAGR